MTEAQAELVAIRALGWLAGNDALWPTFVGASGIALDDLRTAAQDVVFLAGVLDFLTQDDAWVVAFCEAAGLPFDTPLMARRALPGGAEINWT
jgi:hypothetical protein